MGVGHGVGVVSDERQESEHGGAGGAVGSSGSILLQTL